MYVTQSQPPLEICQRRDETVKGEGFSGLWMHMGRGCHMGSGPGVSKQDADRVELLLRPAVSVRLSAAPETCCPAFSCIYFLLFLSHVIFCH